MALEIIKEKFGKNKNQNEHKLHFRPNPKKVVTPRDVRNYKRDGFDPRFVSVIQPQGGITFADKYAITADGYSTCVTVIHYPTDPLLLWLATLSSNDSTLTTIDVRSDSPLKVRRALNRSISEMVDREYRARQATDVLDSESDKTDLSKFALSLNHGGEIPKSLVTRIFVYAPTVEELEQKISNLRKGLRGMDYKAFPYLFFQDKQFKSMAQSLTEQRKDPAAMPEQTVPALTLGAGNPFSAQSLKDPRGIYLGDTSARGAFIFDQFRTTQERTSFNMMILGKMGMGKSTLLKLITTGSFARDMYWRGIDKTGEYQPLVKELGGSVVNLDGSEGMINPLEVMATNIDAKTNKVDELASFYQHLSKVSVLFQMVNKGGLNTFENKIFNTLLRSFYVYTGLLDKDFQQHPEKIHITGLDPQKYPTMSDLLNYVHIFTNPDYMDKHRFSQIKRDAYEHIEVYLNSMTSDYSQLFDGHSTMRDLTDQKIILFDTSKIATMDPNIYHAQLYTALSLIWNHALINGRRQNALISAKKKTRRDTCYFQVVLDECHNIINYDNLFAVEFIKNFEREMRKFNAGVIFATQSPEEMVPDTVQSAELSSLKVIFELCQYKWLMGMDASQLKKMQQLLGNTLNTSDYRSIPELKRAEAIVSMGGQERYKIKIKRPSPTQLDIFAGGQ